LRVLAITTMRNEAPFILEWIAYHRHIGVTDFLIYSNDCADGTDALLDRLAARGIVQHERNHAGGKKSVQWRALGKAKRHPSYKAADWVYVTDVDEFLLVRCGAGHITDLIAARPDARGFAISWRMFGNDGVVRFTDTPVTTQFKKAAPEALLWPWRAVQFKSLYRNDTCYAGPGVHKPRLKDGAQAGHWVDGNGDPMPTVRGTIIPTKDPRFGLAQINHYALGSIESFLVKAERGKPNHSADAIDLSYWSDRNLCAVSDTGILRHQTGILDGIAALMADAETARLHRAGVAWREERIKTLLQQSDYFYLTARLRQMDATRILPMQEQEQMLLGLLRMRAAQKAASSV